MTVYSISHLTHLVAGVSVLKDMSVSFCVCMCVSREATPLLLLLPPPPIATPSLQP